MALLYLAAQAAIANAASTGIKTNATYGKLPLSFEANQGQIDPNAKFLARGAGYSLFLTDTGAVLAFSGTAQRKKVLQENGGKCTVGGCNKPAEHVDHAIPRSQNGDTTDANLQGMCAHHNCQKGARSSAEYEKWLKENGQK